MNNQPRDDELYHWKYIKRVRDNNGKWRYYYHWDELREDARNKIGITQRNDYNRAANELRTARARVSASTVNVRNGIAGNRYATRNSRQTYSSFVSEYSRNQTAYSRAKVNADKALAKYRGTPLGKVAGVVEYGKKLVNNIFSGSSRPRR